MKTILAFFALTALCYTHQSSNIKKLHFFTGNWKVENKENYESWSLNKNRALDGSSYKIRAANKQISEYLTIKERGDQIIYTAQVLNQNNGVPIEFLLNKEIKDKFSFENPAHDFPKKIQYTKLNDTTLFVAVLGDHDKGFSYKLFRQK